jgi:alpha/beta hydrolase family protein
MLGVAFWWPLLGVTFIAAVALPQERLELAQDIKDSVLCNEFAAPKKQATGQTIGVERCEIVSEEIVFNIKGHKFRRVEIRLTGTIEGWVSGKRGIAVTDGPDFVFTQFGVTGPRGHGVGRYEASTGHGMTIIYPEDPRHWNGKLYITAHGAGSYDVVGTLVPRDPKAKFNPLQNFNRYVTLMIDKGYAVAHTMRSSALTRGDVVVTFEDGTTSKNSLGSHAGLITTWTQLAQNLISKRVGAKPKRTYFYGHSAGGFIGRLINYQPGANSDGEGKPIFDGFLIDDAGGGLPLPKLVVNNKDILFTTDPERQRFVKQIDVTYLLYAGQTGDFLHNKRENARLLLEKGLGAKYRMYEIRGVSHFDAGHVLRRDLVFQTLDLSGLFDALIDRLDSWVEKDVPPPPTMSDFAELGGRGSDGTIKNPAVALPEVACPLGVYYVFPVYYVPPQGVDAQRRGGQETAFAAFDGTNMEPLNSRGVFVDMNGDGVRGKRETMSQAWQRLGLLKSGHKLTQAVYKSCVDAAASKIVKEGLLPKKVGEFYVEQANKAALPELSPNN